MESTSTVSISTDGAETQHTLNPAMTYLRLSTRISQDLSSFLNSDVTSPSVRREHLVTFHLCTESWLMSSLAVLLTNGSRTPTHTVLSLRPRREHLQHLCQTILSFLLDGQQSLHRLPLLLITSVLQDPSAVRQTPLVSLQRRLFHHLPTLHTALVKRQQQSALPRQQPAALRSLRPLPLSVDSIAVARVPA